MVNTLLRSRLCTGVVVLALSLGLPLLGGCTPECSQACSHLVDDCGIDRPGYSEEHCTTQCERFLAHYDEKWQRDKSREAVRCVRNASCDELNSGMPCYDEAVYPW